MNALELKLLELTESDATKITNLQNILLKAKQMQKMSRQNTN